MDNGFDARKEHLRKQAEAMLADISKPVGGFTPEEIGSLIHDFQVQQIELELQNEELPNAQRQLESVKERCSSGRTDRHGGDSGQRHRDERADHVFGFFPGEQMGTEGEKGTGLGLGLVLCKQFIEQHCGRIWVESAPEQGTTVFFTLPTA